MKPVDFKERTHLIAEHQEEFETLPAHFNKQTGAVTFCCQLTPEEIERVKKTGQVWFSQMTGGQAFQAIRLSTLKEDLIPTTGYQYENTGKPCKLPDSEFD